METGMHGCDRGSNEKSLTKNKCSIFGCKSPYMAIEYRKVAEFVEHDIRKLRRFIRYVEDHGTGLAYPELINRWLTDTADCIGQEELQYYMDLIPMIQERKEQLTAYTHSDR